MEQGDFLVELLGQCVDLVLVRLAVGPEFDLRQRLVGEGGGHHEAGVAGGVAKVQEAAFRQQDHALPVRERDHVDLRLDVVPLVVAQGCDLDLVVEVADVSDDGHVLHLAHVLEADDVLVAGRRDEDVSGLHDVFEGDDFKAVHAGLKRADRVDFRDLDPGTGALQRGGRALADIAIAAHHGDLAGHHGVGGAADAIDQRLLAAVLVVEFRLGDAVVHVDRGEGQVALFHQAIEAIDARGGFFGDALDGVALLREPAGRLGKAFPDLLEEVDFLFRFRLLDQLCLALFNARADEDVHGGVAAIIEDHVGEAAIRPLEDLVGVVPVLFEALALHGEDRDAGFRNGGCCVVLGREDVARGPADLGAQMRQRLDQHAGLDRHVE